jgi:hypothetical protein
MLTSQKPRRKWRKEPISPSLPDVPRDKVPGGEFRFGAHSESDQLPVIGDHGGSD